MVDAARQDGGMRFCHGCGGRVHVSARACPACGAVQPAAMASKNRVAAAFLAFFLGGFGAHKFYLGRVGQGFLYLLFCWTFIPAVVSFVECFVYLLTSDEAFAAKYG